MVINNLLSYPMNFLKLTISLGDSRTVGCTTWDYGSHARKSDREFTGYHGLLRASSTRNRNSSQCGKWGERIHGGVHRQEWEGRKLSLWSLDEHCWIIISVGGAIRERNRMVPLTPRIWLLAIWYRRQYTTEQSEVPGPVRRCGGTHIINQYHPKCLIFPLHHSIDWSQPYYFSWQGWYRRLPHISRKLHPSQCHYFGISIHSIEQNRRFWCSCEPILPTRSRDFQVEPG